MQLNIQILALERTTKPTAKGSYTQLEVSYKDLGAGKIAAKKIMSFTKPETVFKRLNDANVGESFTIDAQKNTESGYWDWVGITSGGSAPAATSTPTAQASPVVGKPAWQGETAEERQKKQLYIVKQSAIAQAVALLSVGAKTPPSNELVLEQAQKFVDYVFEEKKISVFDLPNDIDVE